MDSVAFDERDERLKVRSLDLFSIAPPCAMNRTSILVLFVCIQAREESGSMRLVNPSSSFGAMWRRL